MDAEDRTPPFGTGLSQQAAEPKVSALRASIPGATKSCPSGHTKTTRNNNNIYKTWWVQCAQGECSWRTAGDTEAEAIDAWNTRVDATTDIVGYLREQADAGDRALLQAVTGSRLERDLAAGVVALRRAAQAIETRRAETEGLGAKHESAVAEGHAPVSDLSTITDRAQALDGMC